MHVSDDLYLGGFLGTQGFTSFHTGAENPTRQIGAGPMGRIVFLNIVPAALAVNNLALAAAWASGAPMTLQAGAGITLGTAPDGSGRTVYVLDVPRCISMTAAGNASTTTALVTGFDVYGRLMTQSMTGPNADTVNSTKAFASILSVVPAGTEANPVSVGTADIFGLPFCMTDAGYIISAKWANTLAQNAGTFVAADTTSPATSSTGDTRGTFAQTGAASNGADRLVVAMHLNGGQCGAQPTITNLIGVTPA